MAGASPIYHIKQPNTTQRTTDVTRVCKDYLIKNFGALWNQRLICIPVLIKCDWEGPSGYSSGSPLTVPILKDAEKLHSFNLGLLTKYNTEFTVFQAFFQTLNKHSHAGMLVHSPTLTRRHLQMVNQTFSVELSTENPMKKKMDQTEKKMDENWSAELTDILLIVPTIGVIVVEVKPSITEWKKAHNELKSAVDWIQSVLLAMGIKTVPVFKIVALPLTPFAELQDQKDHFHYAAKEQLDNFESWFCEKIEEGHSNIKINDHTYEQLATLCLVLKTTVFNAEKASSKLCADLPSVSMHEASLATLNQVTTGRYLEATYKKQAPQKDHEHLPRIHQVATKLGMMGIFNQVMFLTPEQALIWNSPIRKQVIEGYASTGKTVLIQNKVIELLRNECEKKMKVIVIVPPSLVGLYLRFYKLALTTSYDDMTHSGRLIVCDLKQFASIDSQIIEDSHVFRDEFGATYSSYELDILSAAVERLIVAMNSPDKYCWTTIDKSQYSSQTLDIVGAQDKLNTSAVYPSQILQPLSTLEEKMGNELYGYLTSALRCTVQVYSDWKGHLSSKILQQGHNVVGPEVCKHRFHRLDFTVDVIVKTLTAELSRLQADDWELPDIAILILDSDERHPLQLKSVIECQLCQLKMKTNSAKERFQANGEPIQAVTLDFVSNTFSHEWPVVITIMCPEATYISGTMTYIARTRCLVQLITIECDEDQFDLEASIRSSSSENLWIYGSIYCNALAVKVRRAIVEVGTLLTIQCKNLNSQDTVPQHMKEKNADCILSFLMALKDFHKFAVSASKLLLNEYNATSDYNYVRLAHVIMQEYFRCANDYRRNDMELICGTSVAKNFDERWHNLLKFNGDFDKQWHQLWEELISLKLPALQE